MLHEVLSASLSSLPCTPGFIGPISFISVLRGQSDISVHHPRHHITSAVHPPPQLPYFFARRGHRAALSHIAGGSGFLIILLTVHLSDKIEERERPPASLSFNGQPRNEGEAIKAGAEPESLFNVSDRPDRIINQELKEFKTFALGFLT